MLCNALISALERDDALPVALHSELLAYFVLLHADEPPVLVGQTATAPAAVLSSAPISFALSLASAFDRCMCMCMCMCVCMCMCMCMCMRMCMCICTCTRVYVHFHVHTSMCIDMDV